MTNFVSYIISQHLLHFYCLLDMPFHLLHPVKNFSYNFSLLGDNLQYAVRLFGVTEKTGVIEERFSVISKIQPFLRGMSGEHP